MVQQPKDDIRLLDLMLADLDKAPALYQPGNYWRVYERIFLPELRSRGLRDFRRRRHTVLSTFSGTDLSPASQALSRHPMDRRTPSLRRLLVSIMVWLGRGNFLAKAISGA